MQVVLDDHFIVQLEYIHSLLVCRKLKVKRVCTSQVEYSTNVPIYIFNGEEVTSLLLDSDPVPEKFLGIVGQDSSDFKSSRLHVGIFRFCFIHLRRSILQIPLK
jgi:hypothetical protein